MPKVHLLSPDVISKIAAGEIIERPASVIKELMENAFDAQTQSIEIHLKDAGKTLIQIKDTGEGIEKEDLERIFARHATSKITNIDDLESIHSLGFRGEALYSIAAIADVTLRSKTASEENGWEIHIRGGQKIDFRPITMATGTEIEVQELFFNTPARKKFLKTNTTELNQILNTFIPYTLLYPNCRFRIKHQEKDLFHLRPNKNLISRAAEVLNLNEHHLIETQKEFPEKNISIHMILGDINISRPRRDLQFLFINNRPVQSRSLAFHLNQVYRLILPPEKSPCFIVYIQLPGDFVDVNIHPAKREVKLKEEGAIVSLLRSMCEGALLSKGQAKQVETNNPASRTYELERTLTENPSSERAPSTLATNAANLFSKKDHETLREPREEYFRLSDAEHWRAPEIDKDFFIKNKENLQDKLKHAQYVGQFIRKFLFFELDRTLLVVDQHAAQERINYEKFCQQIESGQVEVQNLLSPVLIDVSVPEMLAWEEAKEKLEHVGFASTQFDSQTVAIHSHPQLISDAEFAVRQILSGEDIARCDHNTIAGWACKASIRAGDKITVEEAEHQRDQLIQCKDPFTCPHGRPTVIELTEDFLDKQFLRS